MVEKFQGEVFGLLTHVEMNWKYFFYIHWPSIWICADPHNLVEIFVLANGFTPRLSDPKSRSSNIEWIQCMRDRYVVVHSQRTQRLWFDEIIGMLLCNLSPVLSMMKRRIMIRNENRKYMIISER